MANQINRSFLEKLLFPPVRFDEKKFSERVAGKTVLITGASFGIGEQTAYLFGKTKAKIILVARTADKLSEVKTRIETLNKEADVKIFSADLTKDEEIEILAEELKKLPQGTDILISNAGKSIRRPLFESLDRFHDFRRTMALNYFAPVRLILELTPSLKENKGQIINVSAVNTLLIPAPYWAAYQASKTAFDQWFRCAAPELEAAGISTTSIYLPLVKTRMIAPTAEYKNAPAMSPEQVAKIICRSVCTRRKIFKPWWLIFGQTGSLFLRRPWEFFMNKFTKNNLAGKYPKQ